MNFSLTLFKFSYWSNKPTFRLFSISTVKDYKQFGTNTFYDAEWSTVDFKWKPYYVKDVDSWCFSFLGLTLLKAIG